MSNITFFFSQGFDPDARQAFLDVVKQSYPRAQSFVIDTEDGSAATFYVQFVQRGAELPKEPPPQGQFHVLISSNHAAVSDWNIKYQSLRTVAIKYTENDQRGIFGRAGLNQREFKQALDQLLRTTAPLHSLCDDLITLNQRLRMRGLHSPEQFLSTVSGYQQMYNEPSTDVHLVFSDSTPRADELRAQLPAVIPSFRNIEVVGVTDEESLSHIDDDDEKPVIVLVFSPPGNTALMSQAREMAIQWTQTRTAPSAFVYSFGEYDARSPPSVDALMTMVREGMDQLNNRAAMQQWAIYYHPQAAVAPQFEHFITELQKRRATMNVTAALMVNRLSSDQGAE